VGEGLGGGNYEDEGGSLLWHQKGNLVPDFSFPFLDDLCRLLICKIVMVYI